MMLRYSIRNSGKTPAEHFRITFRASTYPGDTDICEYVIDADGPEFGSGRAVFPQEDYVDVFSLEDQELPGIAPMNAVGQYILGCLVYRFPGEEERHYTRIGLYVGAKIDAFGKIDITKADMTLEFTSMLRNDAD